MALYFLRHAQTDCNAEGRWMGLRDDPLNSIGLMQAERVARELTCIVFPYLHTSPLLRARQTAEIVARWQTGNPTIVIDHAWRERDFGEFEGLQKSPNLRRALEQSPSVEGKENVRQRLNAAMARINQYGEPVLVVSHSAVFRVLTEGMRYRSEPATMTLDNAQYVRLCRG